MLRSKLSIPDFLPQTTGKSSTDPDWRIFLRFLRLSSNLIISSVPVGTWKQARVLISYVPHQAAVADSLSIMWAILTKQRKLHSPGVISSHVGYTYNKV